MIQQLNPPLPLMTPKGKAWAHLVIDYGPDIHRRMHRTTARGDRPA